MASLIVRKNADNLNATELKALRAGYAKAQTIMDNRGYNHFAGYHGIPNWFCWHHSHKQGSTTNANLFLPWHRAYLLYFDRAIRDQSPLTPKVGLPWWDWSSDISHQTGVPNAFSVATVSGQPNPLFKARIVAPTASPPINRFTRRFPGNPASLPTKQQITNLLNVSQFVDFTNQLENIHDGIHGWTGGNNGTVGGDMGSVATAAWDPIFWSHHCMIDRLWYLWQLKHGVNNITPSLLPMVLQPFGLKVQDVLSINALGYEYAVSFVQL
jgi:tyrosinase